MARGEAEHAIRRAVQSLYLGDHIALTRILGFYKFFIDTRDVGFGGHVLLDGYWEIWLTLFCLRNLRTGMVAVDIGANAGYYTVLFAGIVGPGGKVAAIEPNPAAADLLRRNIDINGFGFFTRVHEAACSDGRTALARLAVPVAEPKNACLVPEESANEPHVLDVACVALDEVCADYEQVDFIKIDAEGSEEKIFDGMMTVLERHRPTVVIEVNVARYADAAAFVAKLKSVYGELRYVGYDGHAVSITEDELLSRDVGQDWLVVLSPFKSV